MSDNNDENKFTEILEKGANVDAIFKDNRPPFGADPFNEAVPISSSAATVEKKEASIELDLTDYEQDDSAITIQKKYIALEELFKLVNSTTTFGKFTSDILSIAMSQVRCEAASFFEVDYENDCLFFRSVAGKSSQGLLKITVPLKAGIVGKVCDEQATIVLSETKDASIHLKSIGTIVGFEATDVIAIPVVIRGKTYGCIELLNPYGSSTFSKSDREVLEAIAQYAGKIIENRLVFAACTKELQAYKSSVTTPAKKAA